LAGDLTKQALKTCPTKHPYYSMPDVNERGYKK